MNARLYIKRLNDIVDLAQKELEKATFVLAFLLSELVENCSKVYANTAKLAKNLLHKVSKEARPTLEVIGDIAREIRDSLTAPKFSFSYANATFWKAAEDFCDALHGSCPDEVIQGHVPQINR